MLVKKSKLLIITIILLCSVLLYIKLNNIFIKSISIKSKIEFELEVYPGEKIYFNNLVVGKVDSIIYNISIREKTLIIRIHEPFYGELVKTDSKIGIHVTDNKIFKIEIIPGIADVVLPENNEVKSILLIDSKLK